MKLLLYLLQVSACTGVFYLFYHLALSRLTFFSLNRWYLLISLLLSFAVPLIEIPADTIVRTRVVESGYLAGDRRNSPGAIVEFADTPEQSSPSVAAVTAATEGNSVDYERLLLLSYLAVTGILSLRLIISLLLLWIRLKAEHTEKKGDLCIVRHSRHFKSGSFFHYVFVADKGLAPHEVQQIIAHETVHACQLHSVDKLLAGVVKVVLWFNPFAYAYTHAIDANHEFEVDREICRQSDKKDYAELLLRLATSEPALYHHFSRLPLQKRISMLYNIPSKSMKKSIFLLSLPLVAASLLAFANRQAAPTLINNPSVENSTVSNPEITPEASDNIKVQDVEPVATTDAAQAEPKEKSLPKAKPKQASTQAQTSLLDYNNVKKIREGETTLAEVKKLFGEPSEKELTEKYENWHYKINGWLRIQFDKGGIVTGYSYRLDDQDIVPVLDVNDVRRIQVNTSDEAEILRTFGKPSSVQISPTTIGFFYQLPKTNTSLSVQFRRLNTALVSHFKYSTQHHNPVTIDAEKVEDLEKVKSTVEDILQRFGEPNSKKVHQSGEYWSYSTDNASLILQFKKWEKDKGAVLENYLYRTSP